MLSYHGGDLCLTSFSEADWASGKNEHKFTLSYSFLISSWNNFVVQQERILQCFMYDGLIIHRLLIRSKRFSTSIIARANKVVLLYCDSMVAIAYTPDLKYRGRDQIYGRFVIIHLR